MRGCGNSAALSCDDRGSGVVGSRRQNEFAGMAIKLSKQRLR